MAYIELIPKTYPAEQQLTQHGAELADLLAQAAKAVLEVPDHDIIVELRRCTTLAFNALAVEAGSTPDVIVKIATSDLHLKPRFPALASRMVDAWNIRFGKSFQVEVWVNLIDAWNCNIAFD